MTSTNQKWRKTMHLSNRNPLLNAAAVLMLAMGLALSPVANAVADEDIVIETVPGPFDKVVTNLKRAITGQKLVIIKEVPLQQMLSMVGLKTEKMMTFEIFHPRYGKQMYQADPTSMKEAPLRIVVREDGDDVMLEYRKPSVIFAPYSSLEKLGEELDTVFGNIVAAVAK
jgi:uncharacterized protein (DUF302 family)